MKQKIKVKVISPVVGLPQQIDKGDWVDLRCAKHTIVGREPVTPIPLGVAMELPKGYEAIVASRSSTPKKMKIWLPAGIGVIDNSYNADTDQWFYPAAPIGQPEVLVSAGDRICQFRVQLSQKASVWQRVKWLFTSGIEFVEVETLNNEARGGLGSTGVK